MTQDALPPQDADRAPFVAVLRPNRSLSRSGFLVLMALISLFSFVAGMVFLAIGAWPVFGFLGLDVVLIYVAFQASYRSGRAYETLEITSHNLRLTRVSASGHTERHDLNPYWVRVRLSEGPEGRNRLALSLHGRELTVGQFLTNDEREELARAVRAELAQATGGARI